MASCGVRVSDSSAGSTEVQRPIEATKTHPRRFDYEYKRAGMANIFMFAEPLAGWRNVAVRDRKTKVDWAIEMANLLEGRYADCAKVLVENFVYPLFSILRASSFR